LEVVLKNFEDSDEHTCQSSLESLGKISLIFGPAAVVNHMDEIVEWIIAVLKREAPCQQIRESFQEDDEEEFSLFSASLSVV
jgi:hypothetical protein